MTAPATLGCPVPVLRVPRWEDAADFYLDHLGFEVLWQHRPGIDHTAPGGPTIELIDPCGNVLRFCGTARNDFASREEHPMPPRAPPRAPPRGPIPLVALHDPIEEDPT